MTLWLDIHKDPDGSPTGSVSIKSCNIEGVSVETGYGSDQMATLTDNFQDVKSFLGTALEQIGQAEANEDPS